MRPLAPRPTGFWHASHREWLHASAWGVLGTATAAVAVLFSALPAQTDVCGEWEVVSTPIPETGWLGSSQFRDVTVIAPDDAWAVGCVYMGSPTWQTLTLAMHWDGVEWTIVPTPSPSRSINELETVVAVSSDDVWAAGVEEQFNPFRELHPLILH